MIDTVWLCLICSGPNAGIFFLAKDATAFSIRQLTDSLLGMLIVGVIFLPWILRKSKKISSEDTNRSSAYSNHDQPLPYHHQLGHQRTDNPAVHTDQGQVLPRSLQKAGLPKHGRANYSQQLFTNRERSFLGFLYQHSFNGKLTSISEINQFLGVAHRNIDIQKRMRSDLVSSINQKVSVSAGLSKPLIDKKRSSFDKRSFDYFIRENHFDLVRSLVLDSSS